MTSAHNDPLAGNAALKEDPAEGRLRAYHRHTRGAFTGFLMGAPLALTYTLCIVLGPVSAEQRDFSISLMISLLGERLFTAIQVGLAISFIVLVALLRRRGTFRAAYLGPLVVEAMVYAVLISAAVWFGLKVLHLRPAFPAPAPGLNTFISALGEAVNQETLFRWILLEVLHLLLTRTTKASPLAARGLGVLLGAAIYTAVGGVALMIGAEGNVALAGPLSTLYLTGVLFGCLYHFRGYPLCAYTHMFLASFWGGVVPYLL